MTLNLGGGRRTEMEVGRGWEEEISIGTRIREWRGIKIKTDKRRSKMALTQEEEKGGGGYMETQKEIWGIP